MSDLGENSSNDGQLPGITTCGAKPLFCVAGNLLAQSVATESASDNIGLADLLK